MANGVRGPLAILTPRLPTPGLVVEIFPTLNEFHGRKSMSLLSFAEFIHSHTYTQPLENAI